MRVGLTSMTCMIKEYIKKPIPVKAIVFTGEEENIKFIVEWSLTTSDSPVYTPITREGMGLAIHTLEGTMRPKVGDYVIQGFMGEFWFVNGPIFEQTYSTTAEYYFDYHSGRTD